MPNPKKEVTLLMISITNQRKVEPKKKKRKKKRKIQKKKVKKA